MRSRIKWKTILKLCLALIALYVGVSYTYIIGGSFVRIVLSKRYRGSLLHRESIFVNPYPRLPVKRCTNETTSAFLTKSSLGDATVITRSATTWSRNVDACAGDDSFVKTRLMSPSGDVTIFAHPEWKDRYVSATVIGGELWEAHAVERFVELMRNDCSLDFIDVGGNIGVYGLSIANMRRRVIFIEPLLTNVRKLCASITAGEYPDVHVIHNAVSSRRSRVGLVTYAGNIGGTYIREVSSDMEEETTQAILLDDILEIFRLRKVAMKMDIQGHEAQVLQAADNFFHRTDVSYLLLEWAPHKNSTTGSSILNFLRRHSMTPHDPGTDDPLDLEDSDQWPNLVFWKKATSP